MLTVGDCQQIYDKYKLGISEHCKETTLLCQVILKLEMQIAKGGGQLEPHVGLQNVPFIIRCPSCDATGGRHDENCEYVTS